MSKHINSASRVYNIFSRIKASNSQSTMISVWSDIFSIKENDVHKKNFEISRCLNLLHEELLLISESMDNSDFSGELYKPYLKQVLSIASVQSINGNASSYQNILKPEVLLSINYCSEIISDEEKEINIDDLEEVLNLISNLENELENKDLPNHLKSIILKNIKEIKEAIHSYNIVGVKAFHNVIKNAYGDVILNQEVFKENNQEINVLVDIWNKVLSVSNGIIKIENTVNAGSKLIEHSSKAIDLFNGMSKGI